VSETRKLAAILAADVAGYSRLAGAEEERTLARRRHDARRTAGRLIASPESRAQ
jgi:class 3 adenylate cyclase